MNTLGYVLRLSSAVAALLATSLVGYRVWATPPPPPPAPAVYVPVRVVPKPGEVRVTESPANGFILVVESEPDGVAVHVDGVDLGITPASLNSDCKPGQKLELKLSRSGYATIDHPVECKKDVMLVINAKLLPSRGH